MSGIGIDEPTFAMPARIRADMNTIATELKILITEIKLQALSPDIKFYAEEIVKEWNMFYEDVYDDIFPTPGIYDKLTEWKTRVKELRERMIASGGQTVTSTQALKPPDPSEPLISLGTPSPWGWIVAAAIGTWLLIKITAEKTESKRVDISLLRAFEGKPKSHKKGGI